MTGYTNSSTKQAAEIFWGEIAPSEHLVQIYENDGVFMDSLEGFAAGGIRIGDAVIIIATPSHLEALEDRLLAQGINVTAARATDQFIALDAEETLARFIVRGWPDEELFEGVITEIINRARKGGRRVRAFGEMVALLWARGEKGATVRLEHLWHLYCQTEAFSLFCAYPRIGFAQDASSAIRDICAAHSRVVVSDGDGSPFADATS